MAKGMSQASWGLSVAFGFVFTVLASWGLGRVLDNWLGTEPWIQVVGAVIGWVGGVFVVYYTVQYHQD
jgi:F0F1-type ATP synthase assembly protein I